MPQLSCRQVRESTLLGSLIIVVFALSCAYAAIHGGPAWMTGNEFEIFVKMVLGTVAVIVVDLCWKVQSKH